MFQSKYSAASVLLTDDVFPSGETVREVLESKHPPAQSRSQEALPLSDATVPPLVNLVLFDCIDADSIHCAAKCTTGAAGPSGMDAHS